MRQERNDWFKWRTKEKWHVNGMRNTNERRTKKKWKYCGAKLSFGFDVFDPWVVNEKFRFMSCQRRESARLWQCWMEKNEMSRVLNASDARKRNHFIYKRFFATSAGDTNETLCACGRSARPAIIIENDTERSHFVYWFKRMSKNWNCFPVEWFARSNVIAFISVN